MAEDVPEPLEPELCALLVRSFHDTVGDQSAHVSRFIPDTGALTTGTLEQAQREMDPRTLDNICLAPNLSYLRFASLIDSKCAQPRC